MGGGGVGKSALSIRLVSDNFQEGFYDPTIGKLLKPIPYVFCSPLEHVDILNLLFLLVS
jgi:hypothetical protein